MTERPHDDFAHERQALDALHAQNEAQRDNFVGLGHTALFAASVSFVGSVTPLSEAVWRPMLILGWSADVIGLLALTASFGAARRALDAQRAALLEPEAPSSRTADIVNSTALWCFPIALLSLFLFVTANVVHADDRPTSPTFIAARGVRSGAPAESAQSRNKGSGSACESAEPRRVVEAGERHGSAAACTGSPAAGSTSCTQKIEAVQGH